MRQLLRVSFIDVIFLFAVFFIFRRFAAADYGAMIAARNGLPFTTLTPPIACRCHSAMLMLATLAPPFLDARAAMLLLHAADADYADDDALLSLATMLLRGVTPRNSIVSTAAA